MAHKLIQVPSKISPDLEVHSSQVSLNTSMASRNLSLAVRANQRHPDLTDSPSC